MFFKIINILVVLLVCVLHVCALVCTLNAIWGSSAHALQFILIRNVCVHYSVRLCVTVIPFLCLLFSFVILVQLLIIPVTLLFSLVLQCSQFCAFVDVNVCYLLIFVFFVYLNVWVVVLLLRVGGLLQVRKSRYHIQKLMAMGVLMCDDDFVAPPLAFLTRLRQDFVLNAQDYELTAEVAARFHSTPLADIQCCIPDYDFFMINYFWENYTDFGLCFLLAFTF